MGKVIHCELCKKFKFDLTNKWYMLSSKSVPENEVHKVLWDFEIQTYHQIATRRQDQVIVKKEENVTVPEEHKVKLKEIEKRDKYLDFARELEKIT